MEAIASSFMSISSKRSPSFSVRQYSSSKLYISNVSGFRIVANAYGFWLIFFFVLLKSGARHQLTFYDWHPSSLLWLILWLIWRLGLSACWSHRGTRARVLGLPPPFRPLVLVLGFLSAPRTLNGVAMVDRPHYHPHAPLLLTANLVFSPFQCVKIYGPPKKVYYRLIDLRARSFLRGDYQTTWGWAKVFLKALVE